VHLSSIPVRRRLRRRLVPITAPLKIGLYRYPWESTMVNYPYLVTTSLANSENKFNYNKGR